jgi:nicotinate-nucleotide adenylyltransferase
MKIALYLGSFNPFHNGHRDVILTAIKDFGMDKVIIVPSMQNPWKKEKALDFDKRVEIICKAIDSIWFKDPKKYKKELSPLFNYISVEDIEKSLIPPYYSYATLHALKTKYCNDEIYILCGEDTMKSIPDWMHGGKIIEDYDFLVVDRPATAISSTQVREILRTRNKMDAYYSDAKLANYVSSNVINLLKKYY